MNSPFIDFKATEISPEKQKYYFVEPDNIGKLISPKASVVFGERGSGKTTILRHLEKVFNNSSDFAYIGLYYRFETANVKALNNSEMTDEQNILAFSQSMVSQIGKLLCEVLEEIKKNKDVIFEKEYEICQKIMASIEFNIEEKVYTFKYLGEVFENIRRKSLINLQNGKSICYLDYTTLVIELCEELRKEKIFSSTCFCILLDEYENLTYTEQRVINSFIKASSYFLTYKVCMRPEGFLTKDTVVEKEQLMVGHDYEEINYVLDIVGKTERTVKEHLKRICHNRLDFFYKQHKIKYSKNELDIDNYLDIIDEYTDIASWERIEEYKDKLKTQLRKSFPGQADYINKMDNVIDLKLILILKEKKYKENEIFYNLSNFTEKYKNWIHNYKKNIFFQVVSECEQTKKYCGFSTFIKLSNGNTRIILEMLHYAFGDYNESGKIYEEINIKKQTDAVNKVANTSFNEINFIPVNGYKAKSLANGLGNLFASILRDERVKKFETNSFSIKITKTLEEDSINELKDVLHDAIMWGVLIPSKVNKVKNSGDIVLEGRDYILHPIFAPFFKISYCKRQKCELKDFEVYSMLQPISPKEIRTISRKVKEGCTQLELEIG